MFFGEVLVEAQPKLRDGELGGMLGRELKEHSVRLWTWFVGEFHGLIVSRR